MRNELIGSENLVDRFEGFVETNAANKKKVKGFINFYQLQWRSTKSEPNGEEGWNVFPRALSMLQAYAQDSTDVRVTLAGSLHLDDRQLWNVPILFMMGYLAPVQLHPSRQRIWGNGFARGGSCLWMTVTLPCMVRSTRARAHC